MAPRSHQQVELGQKSHRSFSCGLHLRSWRSAVRFTHRLAAWEQGLKSGKAGKKSNAWWVCEAPGKWTAWLLSIWINHDSYGFNGGFWSFWSMRLVGWTMRCVRRLFRNVALPGIPDPVAPTYASCLRPQHVDIEHQWRTLIIHQLMVDSGRDGMDGMDSWSPKGSKVLNQTQLVTWWDHLSVILCAVLRFGCWSYGTCDPGKLMHHPPFYEEFSETSMVYYGCLWFIYVYLCLSYIYVCLEHSI